MRILAVTRNGDKIERNLSRNVARQIRQEKYPAFQHANQVQSFSAEVFAYLLRQRANPSLDPRCGDQDAHPFLVLALLALGCSCPCHFVPAYGSETLPYTSPQRNPLRRDAWTPPRKQGRVRRTDLPEFFPEEKEIWLGGDS